MELMPDSSHFSLVDGRISRRRGIADDGRRLRRQVMGLEGGIGRCGGGGTWFRWWREGRERGKEVQKIHVRADPLAFANHSM